MKSNIHYYKIYGKNIESSFKIDLLSHSSPSNNTDIKIKEIYKLPDFPDIDTCKDFYKIDLKKIFIYIKNCAYITIFEKGSKINVYFVNRKERNNLFIMKLLNNIIPYSLYQSYNMIFHGACIRTNKKNSILILGLPESGKSSFASSLRSFKIMSEDSTLISYENRKFKTFSSHPFLKLSKNIANTLNYNNPFPLEDFNRKRKIYKANNFYQGYSYLKRIYYLEWGKEFCIEKMDIESSLRVLAISNFSAFPIGNCKESQEIQFKFISNMIRNYNIYKITRDKNNLFYDNDNITKHMNS